MSDLSDLMKELLLGDEPFNDEKARSSLEAGLASFDRRLRIARILFWIVTMAMFLACVWIGYRLFTTPDEASMRYLVYHAVIFLVLATGTGTMKMFYFSMVQHTNTQKEVKRMEYRILDALEKR